MDEMTNLVLEYKSLDVQALQDRKGIKIDILRKLKRIHTKRYVILITNNYQGIGYRYSTGKVYKAEYINGWWTLTDKTCYVASGCLYNWCDIAGTKWITGTPYNLYMGEHVIGAVCLGLFDNIKAECIKYFDVNHMDWDRRCNVRDNLEVVLRGKNYNHMLLRKAMRKNGTYNDGFRISASKAEEKLIELCMCS